MATNNMWNSTNPASVISGGTGQGILGAYEVLCGGITTTSPVQSVSGLGTAGDLLISNDVFALPSWQTVVVGSGSWILIDKKIAVNSTEIVFNSGMDPSIYVNYCMVINFLIPQNYGDGLLLQVSQDSGITYVNSDYRSGTYHFLYNSTSHVNYAYPSSTEISITSSYGLTTDIPYNAYLWFYGSVNPSFPLSNIEPVFTGKFISYDGTQLINGVITAGQGSASGGFLTGPINGLKFYASTGLLISGSITLYGLVN